MGVNDQTPHGNLVSLVCTKDRVAFAQRHRCVLYEFPPVVRGAGGRVCGGRASCLAALDWPAGMNCLFQGMRGHRERASATGIQELQTTDAAALK